MDSEFYLLLFREDMVGERSDGGKVRCKRRPTGVWLGMVECIVGGLGNSLGEVRQRRPGVGGPINVMKNGLSVMDQANLVDRLARWEMTAVNGMNT